MKKIFSLVFAVSISVAAVAQHEHHMPESKKDTVPEKHEHHAMGKMDMSVMSHAFSKQLSMNRNGSGTSWLPDDAPMYGYMFHTKKWMYMLHGNIFLRYTNQDAGK